MGTRQMARERALQFLFALEFAPAPVEFREVEELFLRGESQRKRGWDDFARALAEKVHSEREALDATIGPALNRWKVDRLPVTDRLCLRMALCEMQSFDQIPLRVSINEYLELAKRFSPEDAHQYLNAVLDNLANDYRHKDFDAKKGSKTPEQSREEDPS